jgi:hypothetical protein
MKKTVSVACALVLVLGLSVSGALAYTFNDNTLAVPYIGNSAVGAPVDVVGDPAIFDTKGANLTGSTFTIYSNWGPARDGYINSTVKTADLFIDLGCNGIYDYAIRLDTTGLGNVYQNPTYQTSQDIFAPQTSLEYAGRYDVDDAAHAVPVWTTVGTLLGVIPVAWGSGGANSDYQVAIDFTGFAFPSGPVGFIWGTATCSNDAFAACVPIPPSVLLMGSGLLGVGLLGWRRRQGSENQVG